MLDELVKLSEKAQGRRMPVPAQLGPNGITVKSTGNDAKSNSP